MTQEQTQEQTKGKILLVDDDKFLLDIYANKFKSAGLTMEPALSGEEALQQLKEKDHNFDIVILDVIMPNISGVEVVEKIKKENLAPEAKIVMLTNQDDVNDLEKLKSLGIDKYIAKATMTPSEVVAEVVKLLDAK